MRKSQDARQSDNRGVAVVFRFSASANYACAGLRSQGVRRLGVVRQGDEPSGINRLYCEEGLTVRKTGSAARPGSRSPILVESKPNARWSVDFVHDQVACSRKFRILNIVDDVTRESWRRRGRLPPTGVSTIRYASSTRPKKIIADATPIKIHTVSKPLPNGRSKLNPSASIATQTTPLKITGQLIGTSQLG